MNDFSYIVFINRYYRHEYECNDYHLEKIFSKEQIIKIINDELKDFKVSLTGYHRTPQLIITDDHDLLSKYIFSISSDEFKFLCGELNNSKRGIRINEAFFDNISDSEEVLGYFKKIQNDELMSATMNWENVTDYPHDDNIRESYKSYVGWSENKHFEYLENPGHYKIINNADKFYLEDYKIGNIESFKKIINVDILEIGKGNKNWDFNKDGFHKYFDKISYRRLLICETVLSQLKKNKSLNFKVETKFTNNKYIEYYITEIYNERNDDDENDNYENDDLRQNDKYNSIHGLDDNTIDNAFDGDPDNYWNID